MYKSTVYNTTNRSITLSYTLSLFSCSLAWQTFHFLGIYLFISFIFFFVNSYFFSILERGKRNKTKIKSETKDISTSAPKSDKNTNFTLTLLFWKLYSNRSIFSLNIHTYLPAWYNCYLSNMEAGMGTIQSA